MHVRTDAEQPDYRDFLDAYARSLGVEPEVNRATGEHVYNLHRLAEALGTTAEELFEQFADEDGCMVLVNESDLGPVS